MLSKEDRKLIARALGGHAVRNLKAWRQIWAMILKTL